LLNELLALYDKETDPEKQNRLLSMPTVVGAYIKRRGNLIFLAEKAKVLDCADLMLCLQESIANLDLLNVKHAHSVEDASTILVSDACSIYDFFEQAIEAAMDTMRFYVKLHFVNGAPVLRMEIECETSLESFASIADTCTWDSGV